MASTKTRRNSSPFSGMRLPVVVVARREKGSLSTKITETFFD